MKITFEVKPDEKAIPKEYQNDHSKKLIDEIESLIKRRGFNIKE